jgi:transcriptional regulator with XRE-family HTH domain
LRSSRAHRVDNAHFIGRRLKAWREKLGLTQAVVAKRVSDLAKVRGVEGGTGNTAISRWENEQDAPGIVRLPLLCEVLGKDAGYFVETAGLDLDVVDVNSQNEPTLRKPIYDLACPLSERLKRAQNQSDFLELIRQYPRSRRNAELFDASVGLLDNDDRFRVAESLCRLIEQHGWVNPQEVILAPYILNRMLSTSLGETRAFRRLMERLEEEIENAGPKLIALIEPMSLLGIANNAPNVLELSIPFMIFDQKWQIHEIDIERNYFGSEEKSAWAAFEHFKTRNSVLHVHEIARVIHLYPKFHHQSEFIDLMEVLKQNSLSALRSVNVSKQLIGKVEDLLAPRVG